MAGPPIKSNPTARLTATRLRLLIASAICIGAFVAFASRRLPCAPASGTALKSIDSTTQSVTPSFTQRMRIATFNIHSGVGTDGRFDLARIADALREFDLVGLNEVRGSRPWCADQAEQLGVQLHRSWLFAPFERRWFREDFGNGVLSRLPVSHWLREPLPYTTHKGHGNLLELTLATHPNPLRILMTHIDRQTDHDVQLKTVIDRFLSVPSPVILMGDMNSSPDDPQLAALLRTAGVRDALQNRNNPAAGKSHADSNHIDWILTRGLIVHRSEIRSGVISDHPVVCAELELEQAGVSYGSDGKAPKPLETTKKQVFQNSQGSGGMPSRAALLQTRQQTLK